MSKQVGLYWIEERDAEIDPWVEKILQLTREKKFEEALQELLLLMEKYHEGVHQAIVNIVHGIGWELAGRLREMNTGVSLAILSEMYDNFFGVAERNNIEKVLAYALKAAEMGSVYGEFLVGRTRAFYHLADGSLEEPLCWYLRASRMGCREACLYAGDILWDRREWKRAVRVYLMGGSYSVCKVMARRIIREHSYEVTPWGEWSCTDPIILKMVMPSVFEAQRSWMLCAKHFGINQYVALIIADFICTESGWTLVRVNREKC